MHGTHDTVNRICDHPDIQAISFVGSNSAGQYVYERGSKSGKRVQASAPALSPAVADTHGTALSHVKEL